MSLRRRMMQQSRNNYLMDGTYKFAVVSNGNHVATVNGSAWKAADIPIKYTFDIREGDSVTIVLSNIVNTAAYYHDMWMANGTDRLYLLENKSMTYTKAATVTADKDYLGISIFGWELRANNLTYECDISIFVNDKQII